MEIEVEFYELPDGTEPAKEYIETLDCKIKAKIFREIDLLVKNGTDLRMPHSRNVGDGIFELRAKQSSQISRIMYFFYVDRRAILTNGFTKKTQKTPKREIDLAKTYMADYYKRNSVTEGDNDEQL